MSKKMQAFQYKNNQLHCEGVSVARIAKEVGTPCYVYSYQALVDHFDEFDAAFREIPHVICFAAKANSNLAILRAIAQRGGGADIVTGGELFRCLTARVDPQKIVYSGVGKSAEEIAYALKSGILMFNVESADELAAIDRVARSQRRRAPVALRVNPDIDPRTHPYISTGLKKSKFGIRVKDALRLYAEASRYKHIELKGLSCHIGSQITELDPFIETMQRLKKIVGQLRRSGIAIKYVDVGGGLGVRYHGEKPPTPAAYGRTLQNHLKELDATIVFEPGRVIAANAGIFVTKVIYNKASGRKQFIVVDGAMNDLLRPSLYGSYHEIQAIQKRSGKKSRVDVVGPICESGDFLATDRLLPKFQNGELMAVMSAGAYGFTMASNYNSRPRVAEVLIRGRKLYVIRDREKYQDLPRGEHVPRFLVQ